MGDELNYNKNSSKKKKNTRKSQKSMSGMWQRKTVQKYDKLHAETYCKYCGLVLTAQYHIFFQDLKRR